MKARRNINYTRLAVDEDIIGSESTFDPRFDMSAEPSDKIPWKSIVLTVFLLFLDAFFSFFLYWCSWDIWEDKSQAYGLLGLGTLTFLPGFYETRITYYSWRGAQGYRFAAIPSY